MEEKALSITEFNTIIKRIFDAEEMLHGIKVFGEITGWGITRGIAYFSVKDENAVLSCVCFSADRYSTIKDGDQVVLTGSPNYYVKGGKFNFSVSKIEPYGQGLLFKQFLELKAKLESEGLFALDKKQPLPKDIRRIGVVSSEGGAVIQDIINVSTRRNPFVDIVLYPVKVQGMGAEKEIVKGIKFLDNYDVDVVIVARGGGSIEDLQPFNTEIVARATAECVKPVVSAVGHETDFTIIDFASDLRAPTPSAAAEIVCKDILGERQTCFKQLARLRYLSEVYLQARKNKTNVMLTKLLNHFDKTQMAMMSELKAKSNRLFSQIEQFYSEKSYLFSVIENSLKKMNPSAILRQGYAKIEQEDKLIDSVEKIDLQSNMKITVKDGSAVVKPIAVERRKT